MKKELRVHIYAQGSENENLIRIIGSVNSGNAKIGIKQIAGYLDCMKAIYPTVNKNIFYTLSEDQGIIDISEDNGKNWTLQITEVVVHSLDEELTENPVFSRNHN